MPESDALTAATMTLKSVDSCFTRLNVTITDRGTPDMAFMLRFQQTRYQTVNKPNYSLGPAVRVVKCRNKTTERHETSSHHPCTPM